MFKVCRHQLRTALASPRVYAALFVGCVVQIVCIMPLAEFAEDVGKPLCALEGFLYFGCARYTLTAAFLGILLLAADIPFSAENENYTLLRLSRFRWLGGKILYLLCICVLYYAVLLLAGMAYLSKNAYAADFWSEPFYMLAQGMDFSAYNVYFPYPHILLLTPVQAALSAMGLNILYGFVMSLFLFFCNLKLPRALGYAATGLVHVAFYMILSLFRSLYYTRYSLLGQSLLAYHSIGGYYRETFPTLGQSFLVFGLTAAVLTALDFWAIRGYDFRITSGTK